MKKILFLCTHNAARSQIAEGLVNAQYSDRYKAYNASNEPTGVHPCATEAMDGAGIDISAQRAKSLDEFNDVSFGYVVTSVQTPQRTAPSFRVV